MPHIEGLSNILKLSFNWHGARLDFLAKCIKALLTVRSVNLTKIVEAFSGKAKIDSHYKRLGILHVPLKVVYTLLQKNKFRQ